MSRRLPIIHGITEHERRAVPHGAARPGVRQRRAPPLRAPAGRGHGAVAVVPMLDAETVLLVREYAAGMHRYELGLVKGRIDAGESP